MENTLENKVKYFTQYWGQKVFRTNRFHFIVDGGRLSILDEDEWLELIPLSQITDEHLRKLSEIILDKKERPLNMFEIIRWDWCIKVLINKEPHYQDENVMVEMHININFEKNELSFIWEHIHSKGIGHEERHLPNALKGYQYLISKGYYVGDGSEVEYGWVKLKK